MNETEQAMNKVELISVKHTGTFFHGLELSEVTLKRGDQTITEVMYLDEAYWNNPELLGLEGTFEELLEGDMDWDFEDC